MDSTWMDIRPLEHISKEVLIEQVLKLKERVKNITAKYDVVRKQKYILKQWRRKTRLDFASYNAMYRISREEDALFRDPTEEFPKEEQLTLQKEIADHE